MNAVSQVSSDMSAALAVDLAAQIWPESTVFQSHGIDPVDGAKLLQQEWFRKMVDEARREWGSITNAKERIRLKTQVAVEGAIGDLYTIVTDSNIPAAARVAAFKELKDIAGVSVQEQAGPGSHAPTVNIYLGDSNTPAFSIQGTRAHTQESDDYVDVTPGNDEDFIGNAPL